MHLLTSFNVENIILQALIYIDKKMILVQQ